MQKQRRLKREIVVETAVAMANAAGGYEAVTLVALARSLNVRMPSLYNHIAGLDDLRQAMAIYASRDLLQSMRSAAVGLVGQAALLAMAAAYRRFAREHPGIYPLVVNAPEADDPALVALTQEFTQTLLLVLASLGLVGEAALHAMRGYRAVLHGFTALEAAGGYRLPLSKDESFHALITTYLDGLAAGRQASES
jgi:AcrR family transcriptional regulator